MSTFREMCDDGNTRPLSVYGILTERERQEKKWGPLQDIDRSLAEWFLVLAEEVGEVANAILERPHSAVREELFQVAAVALSILDSRALEQS